MQSETDPEKKIEKIFDYVRVKIKNIHDDRLNLSAPRPIGYRSHARRLPSPPKACRMLRNLSLFGAALLALLLRLEALARLIWPVPPTWSEPQTRHLHSPVEQLLDRARAPLNPVLLGKHIEILW